MSTYLERYINGEHAQVWKELVALGDAVMREPLHSDAYAVAQETMHRVRHNVELLASRLKTLGFEFQYPKEAYTPPSKEVIREIKSFEREVGAVPLSLRAWAEIVGGVNFMGNYPRLSYYASTSNPFVMMGNAFGQAQQINLNDLLQGADFASILGGKSKKAPTEDKTNDVFSALHTAFQNLMGQGGKASPSKASKADPELSEDEQAMSDPLVVDLTELSSDAYEEWKEYEADEHPFCINIAPDIFHKSNISGGGGYEINLPHAAADAPLLNTEWGDLTFVEYLRLSFEWGGFPGLQDYPEPDEAVLASLKEGLLPI